MSVVRLQQLSYAIECWLQSNVKDVVRLIARLLWGTKVRSWAGGVSLPFTRFVDTGPFGVGQGHRAHRKVTAQTVTIRGLECKMKMRVQWTAPSFDW